LALGWRSVPPERRATLVGGRALSARRVARGAKRTIRGGRFRAYCRKQHAEQAADRCHRKGDIVEVVAPDNNLSIAHVEAPADPELDAHRPEPQDVRALRQNRRAVGRDGVHVDVEPASMLNPGPKETPNALASAHHWQAHVGVLDILAQEVRCSVDIPSAKKVQEPLDDERRGPADP
jgi:hypothetical protein